jgi:hypothetical protein
VVISFFQDMNRWKYLVDDYEGYYTALNVIWNSLEDVIVIPFDHLSSNDPIFMIIKV